MTDLPLPAHQERAASLIAALRNAGIGDEALLKIMASIPRPLFVPATFQKHGWDDVALPIGQGQTISQPFVVAKMTAALELQDRHGVLEIGTGSGYQTAILSRMVRRIFTIERHRELVREAEARFARLRFGNIVSRFGDGTKGWPEAAPFDRIIVTAAAETLPDVLIRQLAPGGVLVAPLGKERRDQMLVRIRRAEDGSTSTEELGPVRFVPLVAGLPRNAAVSPVNGMAS